MALWEDGLQYGLRSAQPAASSVGESVVYVVTDEGVIEQNQGGTWTQIGIATTAGLDWGEVGDIVTQAFGDSPAAGSTGEVADAGHTHGMPANPVTGHESTYDHTGLGNIPDPTGAADGHVWTADGADGAGWETPATVPSDLGDLGDVTVSGSENDGDVLTSDGAGGFAFEAPSGGGDLGDLGDVTVSGSETDGQVLTSDGAGGFAFEDAAGGGSALTVTDESGTVADTAVTSITVPDGTLVDNGAGDVTLREVPTGAIVCRCYMGSTQNIPHATYTVLNQWTAQSDNEGFRTSGSTLTVPAGLAGWYLVGASVSWDNNSSGLRFVVVNRNGSQLGSQFGRFGAYGNQEFGASHPVWLNAGDTLTVSVYQTSGGTRTVPESSAATRSSFWLFKIGSGTVGEAIGAKAYRTTTLSLSNATLTAVPLDAEYWDTDGLHSTSSNTERLTIPAGLGGKWRFTASGEFAANTSGYRQLLLRKNGTDYVGTLERQTGLGSDTTRLNGSVEVDLAAGDYVELVAYQNSGGSLDFGGTGSTSEATLAGHLLATQGASVLRTGTVFPSAPTIGQRYRRSDLDYGIFFYDGTRWLSEQRYSIDCNVTETAQGGVTGSPFTDWRMGLPFQVDDGLYLEHIDLSTYVGTTNDGSNYWTIAAKDSTTGSLGSQATSGDSPSAYTPHRITIDAVANASAAFVYLEATKTGSAGTLYVRAATLFCRRIAT